MAKKLSAITTAVQPSATLVIDDHSYELVYDYNAIAEAEVATGNACNLLHGISAMLLNTMSALQLRGLFYASLKPRQPAITLVETGALIRIDTLAAIMAAISEAWSASMPEKSKNPFPQAVGAPGGA